MCRPPGRVGAAALPSRVGHPARRLPCLRQANLATFGNQENSCAARCDGQRPERVSELDRHRDRALISVCLFSFARIEAALGMDVGDCYPNGKRWWFRLREKGGKDHEMPAHHSAEAYVDAYLQAAGIADQKRGPLFSARRRARASC
jgi:integrase